MPQVLIAPDVQQKIAELAYSLYERRGKEPGHELDDWLEAERRILGKRKSRRTLEVKGG